MGVRWRPKRKPRGTGFVPKRQPCSVSWAARSNAVRKDRVVRTLAAEVSPAPAKMAGPPVLPPIEPVASEDDPAGILLISGTGAMASGITNGWVDYLDGED